MARHLPVLGQGRGGDEEASHIGDPVSDPARCLHPNTKHGNIKFSNYSKHSNYRNTEHSNYGTVKHSNCWFWISRFWFA